MREISFFNQSGSFLDHVVIRGVCSVENVHQHSRRICDKEAHRHFTVLRLHNAVPEFA